MLSPYDAKYYAYDPTRKAANGIDRLSMSLFGAAVDLNPQQIEAAHFNLESPLSNGVILADEVGLGKTTDDTLKVRLMEEDFHRLMFDTEGM